MIYLQYLIDAIAGGSIYALVAVGLVLVFGVMRLLNFAYGQLIAIGGYVLSYMSGQNAVLAGLTLPYSSGAVEGKVCKIKFLKRLMFGRANYDLLRKMALLN